MRETEFLGAKNIDFKDIVQKRSGELIMYYDNT